MKTQIITLALLSSLSISCGLMDRGSETPAKTIDLSSDLDSLQEEKDNTAAELEETNSRISFLQSQLDLQQSAQDDLRIAYDSDIAQKEQELQDAQQQIAKLEEDIANGLVNNNDAQQEIDALEATGIRKAAEIAAVESQIRAEQTRSDAEVQKFTSEIAEKLREFNAETARFDELEAENVRLLGEVETLKSANEGLRTQVEAAREANRVHQETLNGCLETIARLEGKIEALEVGNADLQKQIDTLSPLVDQAETNLSSALAANEKAKEKLNALLSEIERTKAEEREVDMIIGQLESVKREKLADKEEIRDDELR